MLSTFFASSPRNSPAPFPSSGGVLISNYQPALAHGGVYDDVWSSSGLALLPVFGSRCASPVTSPLPSPTFGMEGIVPMPSPSPSPFSLQDYNLLQLKEHDNASIQVANQSSGELPPPIIGNLPTLHAFGLNYMGVPMEDSEYCRTVSPFPNLMDISALGNNETETVPTPEPLTPDSCDETRSITSSSGTSSPYATPTSAASATASGSSECFSPSSEDLVAPFIIPSPRRGPPRAAAAAATNPPPLPNPHIKSKGEKRSRCETPDSVTSTDELENGSPAKKSNLQSREEQKKDRQAFFTYNATPAELSAKLNGFAQIRNSSFLFAVERISKLVDGGEKKEIVIKLNFRFQNGDALELPVHLRLRAFKSGGKCTHSMIMLETEFAYGTSMYTLVFVFHCRNSYKRGSTAATYIGNNDEEGLWFRYQSQSEAAAVDQDGISLYAPKYSFSVYVKEHSIQARNPIVAVDRCTASVAMWSKDSDAHYNHAAGFAAKLVPYTKQPPTALTIRDVKSRKN